MRRTLLCCAASVVALVSAPAGGSAAAPAASDPCPNAEIRELQGSQHLASCRAWELVTPAEKYGFQAGGNVPAVQGVQLSASPDGERATYLGFFALQGALTGSNAGFRVERGPTGWVNTPLLGAPGPNQLGNGLPTIDALLRGSTPDGSSSAYYDNTTEPFGSLWIVREDGSRKRIATASTNMPYGSVGDGPGQPWFEGISDDGRHVVFASTIALVPDVTPTGNEILYEWEDDGANGGLGTIRVVNRTDAPAIELIDDADATLGGSARHSCCSQQDPGSVRLGNAISTDGSRIFFQNPAPVAQALNSPIPAGGGGPVYLREDATATVEVSAPAQGHTPAQAPSQYQYLDGSTTGRYAFFWADGDLTPDAPSSGGIYRYDAESGGLVFVDAAGLVASGDVLVPPTAIASDDGRRLFYDYDSNGIADEGDELRVWDDGDVRTVLAGVYPSYANTLTRASDAPASGAGSTRALAEGPGVSANVTPDGETFVFTATPARTDAPDNDQQVFLYDVESDDLVQVSDPPDPFNAGFQGAASGTLVGGMARPIKGRVVTDDGKRVFFDTYAPLEAEDVNVRLDPYEWSDGTASLLSSGRTAAAGGAAFVGTDASGENAYIMTSDPLAAQDPDRDFDIYSARIDGGFSVATTPNCVGDACQGDSENAQANRRFGSTNEGRSSAARSARASFRVAPISSATRRALASGRAARIRVRVSRGGRVSIRLRARIAGKVRTIARGSAALRTAGSVTVRLRLSRVGRRGLNERGSLAGTLTTRFSGVSAPRVAQLRLSKATFPSTTKKGR